MTLFFLKVILIVSVYAKTEDTDQRELGKIVTLQLVY